MQKIGFLYPGQGSQRAGMAQKLAQRDPTLFERYLGLSDQLSGEPVSQLCQEGSLQTLSQTHIAQPALFAYSLALTERARQLELVPSFVAGHSLGEYTAAVAAGTLSFAEGLALVCQRGHLMKQQQDERPGAMAAVLGLSKPTLDQLCDEISQQDLVVVTNWNAPDQLVVSGTESGVQRLSAAVRAQGTGKVVILPVKGAFHSPLMKPVQIALDQSMSKLCWRDASVPLVANVSGLELKRGSDIRQELLDQIISPVQWVRCVEKLAANGCTTLIELGSGQVLTRLVRLIAPQITAVALDTLEALETFAATQHSFAEQEALQVA
ncbi:MAG TPA: ACP S-malonyltransferase [Ktedonobacteraceae bacterium]